MQSSEAAALVPLPMLPQQTISPQQRFTSQLLYMPSCLAATLQGDLVCCETCPAVYHADCVGLPSPPEGDYHCPRCCCTTCGSGGSGKRGLRHEWLQERVVHPAAAACSL